MNKAFSQDDTASYMLEMFKTTRLPHKNWVASHKGAASQDEAASKMRLPNMKELRHTMRLPHKIRVHVSIMRLSHSTRLYF